MTFEAIVDDGRHTTDIQWSLGSPRLNGSGEPSMKSNRIEALHAILGSGRLENASCKYLYTKIIRELPYIHVMVKST